MSDFGRSVLALAVMTLAARGALATDGELDATFGGNGQVVLPLGTGAASARAAVWTEAGVIVAGDYQTSPGDSDFYLVRLGPSGAVADSLAFPLAFDAVVGGDDIPTSIAAAPGGKVVVAGTVEASGTTYIGVARFDAALDLDFTFDGTGREILAYGSAFEFTSPSVAVLADGSILVGCTYGLPSGGDRDFALFKLAPDGTLDSSFGSNGFTSVFFNLGGDRVDLFRALAVQPDGKIILAGSAQWSATDYDFAVARLLPNGVPDPSFFTSAGKEHLFFDLDQAKTDLVLAVALGSDGRIALVGTASASPVFVGAVAMLLPNGNPDQSFDGDGKQLVQWIGGTGVNELTGAAFESDRTLFVAGNAYASYGNSGDLGVARLLPTGARDPAFYYGSGFHLYNLAPGWESTQSVALDVGRPLLVGTRNGAWALVRLTNALLFSDGFENATTSAWSGTAP